MKTIVEFWENGNVRFQYGMLNDAKGTYHGDFEVYNEEGEPTKTHHYFAGKVKKTTYYEWIDEEEGGALMRIPTSKPAIKTNNFFKVDIEDNYVFNKGKFANLSIQDSVKKHGKGVVMNYLQWIQGNVKDKDMIEITSNILTKLAA